MNAIRTSNQNEEKIFTIDFFLIFGALLFSALVMYALMSTVTEYATSMGNIHLWRTLFKNIFSKCP